LSYHKHSINVQVKTFWDESLKSNCWLQPKIVQTFNISRREMLMKKFETFQIGRLFYFRNTYLQILTTYRQQRRGPRKEKSTLPARRRCTANERNI